ncbi:putative delta-4 fatty acid desaturase [Trypanosoma rangeli]|uniref:Putative delta-4 fatty acid desaturase n=1 Tax=Trypanosoma rangeli TaxID=5698 RepID=A0A422NCE1_TRYRA|nr:putative delta-4 fatty acid desaturase [Trypanosoma rangeli]RNF03141.1 putative delta-4 fatty acid desaturase [Trypanosoma rangeli]|eukprot:RNF03141.1 putative delta-4 fatty acid desaturase [Trypanosoma rangeli]
MSESNADSVAHAGKTDVMRIDGVYYDTLKLAAIHPGGPMMIKMANGTDATRIFVSYHRRRFPHAKYKHMQVASADVQSGLISEEATPNFDLYLELCDKVRPFIGPTKGFAPWYHFIKAAMCCMLVIALDLYAVFTWRPLYLTFLQSLAMAMVGLNVQHDANHGALSANPVINRVFGLMQDVLGGSSISWIIHHNFIHHIYTNEPHQDLDLEISLLRLHRFVPKRYYYTLQHVYFLVLEAVFGPIHVLSNAWFLWSGPEKRLQFISNEWKLGCLMTLIPPLRLGFSFLHASTVFDALVGFFAQYAVGGMYLAFFFLISHNFTGVKKEGNTDGACFLRAQVETSSSVGGWWLGQINGGLNYQIEHHLFPRVHHGYYHYIAPTVRTFCVQHGISYARFNTLWDNVISTVNHLSTYGHGTEQTVAVEGLKQ